MRFVPMGNVWEGFTIAASVYGRGGEKLLLPGTRLQGNYLKRLLDLGINGIYVDDEYSASIDIVDIVSERDRIDGVYLLKDIYSRTPSADKEISKQDKEKLKILVEKLIIELLRKKTTVYDYIEMRLFDEYEYFHSVNVAIISIITGISMKLTFEELVELGIVAMLHDIGNVLIDQKVLAKTENFTDADFLEIKKHTLYGYEYIKDQFEIEVKAVAGILCHHEKFDGSGYLLGRKGTDIPKVARIIAVAEVYDALIADRPTRRGKSPYEAYNIIRNDAGKAFDPEVAYHFLRRIAEFPSGTFVKLNDGREAIVVEINDDVPDRPQIRILTEGGKKVKPYFLSLKDRKNLKIKIVTNIEELETH